MQTSLVCLLPPLLVLIIALLRHNTLEALFVGLVSSALITFKFNIISSVIGLAQKLNTTSGLAYLFDQDTFWQASNIFMLIFLLLLSIIVTTLVHTQVCQDYARSITKKIKTTAGAKLSCLFLSLTLFVDDYLSVLTTSKVGPHLLDRFGVRRDESARLSYSISASMCALSPVSSWGAAIASILGSSGVGMHANAPELFAIEPFLALIKSMPYMFFCLAIVAINLIGAATTTNSDTLFKEQLDGWQVNDQKNILLFFSIITLLVASICTQILFWGNYRLLGGNATFLQALQNTPMAFAMMAGSAVALILIWLTLILSERLKSEQIVPIIKEGFWEIKNILILLILAWALADFLISDLLVGQYLASILLKYLSARYFVMSLFVICALISWMMGTAWATMSLMFPTALAILSQLVTTQVTHPNILFLCIGAIISGSIFGSNLALTSDLVIMASANSKVSNVKIVQAQLKYFLPAGIFAGLMYFLFGCHYLA